MRGGGEERTLLCVSSQVASAVFFPPAVCRPVKRGRGREDAALRATYRQVVARRVEQVANPFHVDLEVRDFDDEFNDFRVGARDALEQRADGPRHDAGEVLVIDVRPHHCVRLARAGLAIREDRRVIPFEDVIDERHADRVKDILLRRLGPEDVVEHEQGRAVVDVGVRVDCCFAQLEGDLPAAGRLHMRARAHTERAERREKREERREKREEREGCRRRTVVPSLAPPLSRLRPIAAPPRGRNGP